MQHNERERGRESGRGRGRGREGENGRQKHRVKDVDSTWGLHIF